MSSRVVALVIIVGSVVAAVRCGGESGETRPPAGQLRERLATGKLGEVQQRLERRGYSVEPIVSRELPRRAPEVSPPARRRKDLPKEARPDLGLQTQLPGDARGLIYRYSSVELAVAMAPAFLGHVWGGRAVWGCDRNVYFTRGGIAKHGTSRARSRWLPDATAAVRRVDGCRERFMVIG
jgi:hypothetical protein